MVTGVLTRLALGMALGVVLCIPALGLPLSGSCLRIGATAFAAPSPSCSSDLRECLRLSAEMRQTTFGVRYVSAEDVSRCMEVFNACIHGGAARGGSPLPPSSTTSGSTKGLPQHFGIKAGDVAYDCRRNGDALTCDGSLGKPFGTTDTYTFTVTGTLSGLTMNGSFRGHQTGHAPADPSCRYEQDLSGSATYVFNTNGTVALNDGAPQIRGTYSCGGSTSFTGEASTTTGTWSAIE